MENYFRKFRAFPAMALLGGLALTACVNDDYDFNEVDSTMGFGGSGLELPTSSTDTIMLVDVLDLNEDDCVKVKPNGDYVFEQEGDDVEPSHPEIDSITVSKSTSESTDIPLEATPVGGSMVVYEAEGDAQAFEYNGDLPEEVVYLESAGTDGEVSFTLALSHLRSVVSSMEVVEIELPSYMQLTVTNAHGATYTQDGSKLTFTNVPTATDLSFDASLDRLTFGVADSRGSLTVDYAAKNISMKGTVHVRLRSAATAYTGAAGTLVPSSFDMNDLTIESVRGKFNPEIDLHDLGDVEITGIPDFLNDENVRVDLYNPQIELTINSNLDMGGFVRGTIRSWKNGNPNPIAVVEVPEMRVQAGGRTRVCICRRGDGITGYDVVQEVPELSNVIETIPDRITFEASVKADSSEVCDFTLGKPYEIVPKYNIEAPIAFAAGAQIVYKDTIDDWNEDIEDFELSDNSYISMTATIENRVPAYLTLAAHAIDVDGRRMGDDEISVEVSNTVIASADGKTSAETPLTIKVTQNAPNALERLDGLVFDISAAAANGESPVVEGTTLNSTKHFLIAKDIKIKLVGTIIGDFN